MGPTVGGPRGVQYAYCTFLNINVPKTHATSHKSDPNTLTTARGQVRCGYASGAGYLGRTGGDFRDTNLTKRGHQAELDGSAELS